MDRSIFIVGVTIGDGIWISVRKPLFCPAPVATGRDQYETNHPHPTCVKIVISLLFLFVPYRAELVTYLENLKIENGQSTLVIAHSMGGLVALHALARAADPRIFKGIIFGSTPFNGTPNILQPFKHGDSILMNKDICSPSTVFCKCFTILVTIFMV